MKLKIEGDTVIAITVPQLKKVVKKFEYTQYLENDNELLNEEIKKTAQLVLKKDSLLFQNEILISKMENLNEDSLDKLDQANRNIAVILTENGKYKARNKRLLTISIISVAFGAVIMLAN